MQAWDLFWRTPVKECFCTDLHHLSVLLFIQHLQKQPPEVFYIKRVFLEISPKACNFIRKETLAQVFSCRTPTDDCFYTFFFIITATNVNISDVCLSFKFRRLQRIWIWCLIFTKSLLSVLFSFSIFCCLSQFCFIFSCRWQ